MAVTVTFTCDACGTTGAGVPGEYMHPDPPRGWTWFWGSELRLTGPHACSRTCWDKVKRSPDGKLYLPESHDRRDTLAKERAARAALIAMDPPSAALGPVRGPVGGIDVFVYFIQRGEDGPVKIGFSKNPRGRLSSLQCGIPERLTLLGVIPGGKEREQELHREFGKARINGEWFYPIAPLVDFIKTKARMP
jgi:hypothetical protein